jgi:hypothetical protein
MELEKEISYNRAEHLLVRLDTTAEKGYPYYTKNEASLDNLPIRKMSGLSQRILQAINYEQVKMKRRENYQYIHEALQQVNEISFPLGEDEVPLAYPFLSKSEALRKKLIENKIYCAQYWSNVLEWTTADSLEYRFAEQLIPLPIDQRSGQSEMDQIVKIIIND